MERTQSAGQLTELLQRTAKAHHQAFTETDGADPDWPIWYATHLRDPLAESVGIELTRTEIVVCLVYLDQEHMARGADQAWSTFYSDQLVDRYLPLPSETLALYYYPACPFCQRVLRVVQRLGVEVDLRNIRKSTEHHDALFEARQRLTVPVLRCTSVEHDRWLPESADIIRYLEGRFGS